jgi:hypothetical protein
MVVHQIQNAFVHGVVFLVYDQEIIFVSDDRLKALNNTDDTGEVADRRSLKSLSVFERIGLCGT